jgi:3-hydroxyisobutyrate dehydrogenase-like beta-hydroxyacid dehydrogenase
MFSRVGLVGVGAMGRALLHRLRLANVNVQAFDISAESLSAARSAGAECVGSAAEAAANVEIVHLFVRTDEDVLNATTGSNGILSGARPGSILLLHSTVLPDTTSHLGKLTSERQVRLIDAPVTAIPSRVHNGEAVFLTGGTEEDIARVRPHLARLGRAVYHFGPLGSGNVAKIAKNLATAIERVAAAEVVWLAEAGGVDPKTFLDMMRVEHNQPLMQRWDFAFAIEDGHAVPRPASNLLNKDVGLAAEYAHSKGVRAEITDATAGIARRWVDSWAKGEQAR